MNGRRVASWMLHPVLLTMGFLLPLWGLRAGWPAASVTMAVNVVSCALVVALERWLPYEGEWGRSHGDVRTDLLHGLLSNFLFIGLFRALVYGALVRGSVALAAGLGGRVWPSHWPLALQVMAGLVLGELLHYWYHRLLHTTGWGWRLHSVHHSAPRLYWLNGLRAHPLDVLQGFTLTQAPLVLLGANEAVMVLVTGFIGINGMLKHSNVDLRTGPLNWLLSTAQLHRWHHSTVPAESQTNYGNNLIVWDLVFGTWFLPAGRRPPVQLGLGEDTPAYPADYWGQLAAPFRRPLAPEAAGPVLPLNSPRQPIPSVVQQRGSRDAVPGRSPEDEVLWWVGPSACFAFGPKPGRGARAAASDPSGLGSR